MVVVRTTALVLCCLMGLSAEVASALAPHVPTAVDTDACTMCHRSHTSASGITGTDRNGTTFTALTVGTFSGDSGDTELCYTCHGIGALGASIDVQTQFLEGAGHSVAPTASPYGPSPKQCSDCHDSHGSERDASGTPPAALLRSRTTTTSVYAGNEYCATCHTDRAADRFDGLSIFQLTGHAEITPTASGTGIVCSACHTPHGSANRPLIVSMLETPSAPSTFAVPANDRRLCAGCHPGASATFPGYATYQTGGHASSAETVAVTGEWVSRLPTGSAETSRKAGECQNCHNPMGSRTASATPVAKLLEVEGKPLCYGCHGIGSTVATDMASIDPTPPAGVLELITGFSATTSTVGAARLQVWSRPTTAPAVLAAPRELLQGRVGPVAAADIDGDGVTELLAARSGVPSVTVMGFSALSGIVPDPGDVALLATADYMVAADVLADVGGLPELVAVTGNTVRAYRYNGAAFALVDSVVVTGTVTGIAAGDVSGSALDELAITSNAPNALSIVTGTSGSLVVGGPYATRLLPRGPSVGDLTGDGKGEIVVANNGETQTLGSVFNAAGSEVATLSDTATPAQRAVSTAVGNILTSVTPAGTSGAEVVIVRDQPVNGNSKVHVFRQNIGGGSFTSLQVKSPNNWFNPSAIVIGDLEGAGRPQVVVAGSGQRPQSVTAQPPGLYVVRVASDNATLAVGAGSTSLLSASGAESAGPGTYSSAWIAVGQLGDLGPSRHEAGAVASAHVSTESALFTPRHVDCVDCHNVHESTATPAAAPLAYGQIRGTWGVSVLNAPLGSITLTEKQGVDREYELCFKCHSSWSPSVASRDIASEFDTRLASVHAIEATQSASQATAGSFSTATPAWSNDSVLYCVDCHNNSVAAQPDGPHTSAFAPIVNQPFVGVGSANATQLCYRCHRPEVYLTATLDGPANPGSTSLFYDADIVAHPALHSFHVQNREIGCEGCHASHGAPREHLMRADVGWVHGANGGTCTNGCHTGGVAHTYTRP